MSESQDLNITDAAKNRILDCLKQRGKGLGIRIKVKTTGCSGLAYVLEYADEVHQEDSEFNFGEAAVFVHPKAMAVLRGSTMDYVKKGLNEGFEFINPNEKNRCGCGESFTV